MTTKRDLERKRIRAARWEPGEGFRARIERTLDSLPPRKGASYGKLALSTAAVAAALFLALALPPFLRATRGARDPNVAAAARTTPIPTAATVAMVEETSAATGTVAEEAPVRTAATGEEAPARTAAEAEEALMPNAATEEEASAPMAAEAEEALVPTVPAAEEAPVAALAATPFPYADLESEATAAPNVNVQAYAGMIFSLRRGNEVSAYAEILGATMTVTSVRVRAADETGAAGAGEASLVIACAGNPAFDPAAVKYTLVVDGTEIPMRDSYEDNGVQRTELRFDLSDWAWDDAKQLELKADIGGEALSIPFSYDPDQAYTEAFAQARDVYAAIAAHVQAARDKEADRAASALPVGLDVAILDRTFTLTGFLYRDDAITLVYSVSGLKAANLEDLGGIKISNVTVDGICAGDGQPGIEAFADGVYENVSSFALGRNPENLPEESLIAFDVVLDDWTPRRVACKVNWTGGTFTLPADADEMAAWAEEADGMSAALYGAYGATVYKDLTSMGLSQELDGVTVTLTSLTYVNGTDRLQLSYKVEGDVSGSRYNWTSAPTLSVDGRAAYGIDSGVENAAGQQWDYNAPVSIAEFGTGEKYEISIPLCDVAYTAREMVYAEPEKTLTFAFTLAGE